MCDWGRSFRDHWIEWTLNLQGSYTSLKEPVGAFVHQSQNWYIHVYLVFKCHQSSCFFFLQKSLNGRTILLGIKVKEPCSAGLGVNEDPCYFTERWMINMEVVMAEEGRDAMGLLFLMIGLSECCNGLGCQGRWLMGLLYFSHAIGAGWRGKSGKCSHSFAMYIHRRYKCVYITLSHSFKAECVSAYLAQTKGDGRTVSHSSTSNKDATTLSNSDTFSSPMCLRPKTVCDTAGFQPPLM